MVLAVTLLALCLPATGAMIRKFDLADLCRRADRIVRATVVDVTAGDIQAGGGRIPTVTYRLKVAETLAGQAAGTLELTMVGEIKQAPAAGGAVRVPALPEPPRLEKGRDYVLFTTPPSSIGLCTTVGLGQGCFAIHSLEKKDVAVNAVNNAGLGLPTPGPVAYSELVKAIRALRAP